MNILLWLAHNKTLRLISSNDQKNIPLVSDFPKFKTSIRLFLVSTTPILVIRDKNHFLKMSTLVSTWDRGYQLSGLMVLASLHSLSCLLERNNRLTVSSLLFLLFINFLPKKIFKIFRESVWFKIVLGEMKKSHRVRIGYYSQHSAEQLDLNKSPAEYLVSKVTLYYITIL